MSAYDLTGLVDVLPIKRTDLQGDNKGTVVAFFDMKNDDDPDDPIATPEDDNESAPVDWWQHYGFVSRPPAEGSESLIVRVGAQAFAIASRAIAAAGIFGKLNPGDVALYSIGKNVLRLNSNGSISMLSPSKGGKQAIFRLDGEKGKFQVMLGNGFMMELSEENGFAVITPGKDHNYNCKNFQIAGVALVNMCGIAKLNRDAVMPCTSVALPKPNPGIFF